MTIERIRLQNAIEAIGDALNTGSRLPKAQDGLDALARVATGLRSALTATFSLTISDGAEANMSAAFSNVSESEGNIRIAAPSRALQVGQVFSVLGSGDNGDDSLEAAKLLALAPDVLVTITDNTQTLAVMLDVAGEVGALGEVDAPLGLRFRVVGTGDTSGDDLQAAKGSAPAAGDVFEVSNNSQSAVTYIGNAAAVASGDKFLITSVSSPAVEYVGSVLGIAVVERAGEGDRSETGRSVLASKVATENVVV